MPDGILSAVVQIAVALIASGLAVKLLTLRQDRRKIAGEASVGEANAASTLSGAALQMVESAQQSARDANTNAHNARVDAEKYWTELNKSRWENQWLRADLEVAKAMLRKLDIVLPESSRPQEIPAAPPPADTHLSYAPPTEIAAPNELAEPPAP